MQTTTGTLVLLLALLLGCGGPEFELDKEGQIAQAEIVSIVGGDLGDGDLGVVCPQFV